VVECDLAKVEVAGSNPVSRSNIETSGPVGPPARSTTRPLRRPLRSARYLSAGRNEARSYVSSCAAGCSELKIFASSVRRCRPSL
jgi:hypothetical protein